MNKILELGKEVAELMQKLREATDANNQGEMDFYIEVLAYKKADLLDAYAELNLWWLPLVY